MSFSEVRKIISLSFCFSSMLDEFQDRINEIIQALPFGENETKRILSIKNQARRLESLAALCALNEALQNEEFSLSDLTVARESGGKPYFSDNSLFFSLSHSDGLAVAAVSDEPIGIDIEWLSDTRNVLAMSERFFSEEEALAVSESNEPIFDFYSIWTRHEAEAKRSGLGLSSIYKSSLDEAFPFLQFEIKHKNRKAILSICSNQAEKQYIKILNPYEELKLYELQN